MIVRDVGNPSLPARADTDERLLSPEPADRSEIPLVALLVAGALTVHGLLVFGLFLADRAQTAQPTTTQEIPVEIVSRVPGEMDQHDSADGKGPAAAETEASKPAEARQEARPAKPAQPPPAQPQTARVEPELAKPTTPASMPFFLFPDASHIGSASARAPGVDEKNDNYKAIVFGMLDAEKAPLEAAARARDAKGSVVVEFSLDDAGKLADIGLRRTSGEADLDTQALALVRRAAPFPPPPTGAQRRFAPMIAFGGT